MRRQIVAGNWKMNKNFEEAETLLDELTEGLENIDAKAEVIICTPFPYLEMATDYAQETEFSIGAHNVSEFESGASTGEVSAGMLASLDVEYCIVGHSERRKYFAETHTMLAKKIESLLKNQICPIFCCGEVLAEREENRHFDVIKSQVEESLFYLDPVDFTKIIIAYEPVWAIGTGKTATSEQAQEMHAFIRSLIVEKYGKEIAKNTVILYGGSCNAKNAKELFANPDVDGGLIGGASLIAEDFLTIVQSF